MVTEKTQIEKELEDDDNKFLASLEELDEDTSDNEAGKADEAAKKAEEEQRRKNKDAEEARKRREAEAKKAKTADKPDTPDTPDEKKGMDPKEQVRELVKKYPDLDLRELDEDVDFQEYSKGKWVAGGKSITEIYEDYISFRARISKEEEEVVKQRYARKSGPSFKGSSGGTGGTQKSDDIFTMEELESLSKRMPYMNPKEYQSISSKYEKSIQYHKNKKQ
jgi:colicin import membrane protein